MSFTFRPATPEDAPVLLTMNAAFNGDTGVQEEEIRRSLLSSHEIVLLAECDGHPAGFCCAQVHVSFCYPRPAAEVTEMFVTEAFRRQGCAEGLLRHLEALLSQEYGVEEMHLLTGADNLPAQAAYRKAGFVPHAEMYLRKKASLASQTCEFSPQ